MLADATVEEAGMIDKPDEIYIRPYPFPYIAAFSLSNDCDSSTIAAFEDWHGYVNGHAPTSYGDGLGLEIGDSFWVWAGTVGGLALYQGYPGESLVATPYARRLAELGRAGWFDSLHSLGNWKQDYQSFRHDLGTRHEVEQALELLDREGLKPFVYTNHSYSPSNLSGPWGFYQKIDDPEHPMYGLDLLQKFGFRYFWSDYSQVTSKFGEQLAYRDDVELRREIAAYPSWFLFYRRLASNDSSPIELPSDPAQSRLMLLAMFNRTIVHTHAADGSPIAAFKRYRGIAPADESSFHLQLSAENLDSLEQRGGAVIVYQHLGVTRDGPDNIKRRSAPPVLSANSVRAWRDIAERAAAGRLFVTTPGRLLDYICRAERLIFRVTKESERWTITLPSLVNSVEWSQRSEDELLNGLAFVIPADAPEMLVLNSVGKKIAFQRAIDPVREDRHALYRPWQKLEWLPVTSS